ncbi:TPA: hypothetical protein HA251_07575 [Candidatus Woesearchaeota archaeon]|nr:hypothetical protein [Candidatus Woesearchaeota archaeon]
MLHDNNGPPRRTTVENATLRRITPPEYIPAVVQRSITAVEREIKKQQILATVTLGGSTAKGTYLQGDHDIDVFVRFATSYTDKEIPEILERVLKAVFRKVERVHGSRDYFHIQREEYTFEFVPVLKIDSWVEARNVTDMSPLHVAYVLSKIRAKPWLSQDIRLTKQFCKAMKVYGAESYIGGFSGHVVDLLNIQYGGFRNVLEAAASWPAKTVLDPESRLDNPLTQLNDAKVFAPLVIVDPVQQDRNSAAAVTKQAYNRLRTAAKEYQASSPDEQARFFTVTPFSHKEFCAAHPGDQAIIVTITPLPGKKDVVGAKCLKVHEHVLRGLLDNEFTVTASAWEFTTKRATLAYALPAQKLSVEMMIVGPPVHKTKDAARFAATHKTTYSKDGRLHAIEHRRYREPLPLVRALLGKEYVKERVVSARCARIGPSESGAKPRATQRRTAMKPARRKETIKKHNNER